VRDGVVLTADQSAVCTEAQAAALARRVAADLVNKGMVLQEAQESEMYQRELLGSVIREGYAAVWNIC
jgi:hypothetical protein